MKKVLRILLGVAFALAGTFLAVVLVLFVIWLVAGDTDAYSRGG